MERRTKTRWRRRTPSHKASKDLPRHSPSELRKYLDERLRNLYERTVLLEEELRQLDDNKYYRVCIFGSARIKRHTPVYKSVLMLARYLAWKGIDILTGGGPGLMEAANKGAQLGQHERKTRSFSYGLPIKLPRENEANLHLDVKRHHQKISSRLDDFMRLSHAVVVTPGGIGTLLELFFSWQLIQVGHIGIRPIVLMDRAYWKDLIEWMKKSVLSRGLIGPKDFDFVSIVDTPEEVLEIIEAHYTKFRQQTRRGRSGGAGHARRSNAAAVARRVG